MLHITEDIISHPVNNLSVVVNNLFIWSFEQYFSPGCSFHFQCKKRLFYFAKLKISSIDHFFIDCQFVNIIFLPASKYLWAIYGGRYIFEPICFYHCHRRIILSLSFGIKMPLKTTTNVVNNSITSSMYRNTRCYPYEQ